MVTTLTKPSSPGYNSSTLPSFQRSRGRLSSIMKTKSPTLVVSSPSFHLVLDCSCCRYSLCHLRQNCSHNFCICCHRDRCLRPLFIWKPLWAIPTKIAVGQLLDCFLWTARQLGSVPKAHDTIWLLALNY